MKTTEPTHKEFVLSMITSWSESVVFDAVYMNKQTTKHAIEQLHERLNWLERILDEEV